MNGCAHHGYPDTNRRLLSHQLGFCFCGDRRRADRVGEGTLEYKEQALAGAVAHVRAALVGQDPFTIEKHRHDLYRDAYWRGGPVLMSAISAVDMALWDLLGQSLGVPVYQLLGGKCRDRVRIYVNGWFAGAVHLVSLLPRPKKRQIAASRL